MVNDGSTSTRWNSASNPGHSSLQVYKKELSDDAAKAVVILNRDASSAHAMAVRWSDIGLSGAQGVRDLWQHQDLGVFADSFTTTVPSHGAVALLIGESLSTGERASSPRDAERPGPASPRSRGLVQSRAFSLQGRHASALRPVRSGVYVVESLVGGAMLHLRR
jgi:hypothetical protein